MDPFKALGVKVGAEADEIKKALDRKKLLYKTEPEKLKKMEEAYEAIVQARSSSPSSAHIPPTAVYRAEVAFNSRRHVDRANVTSLFTTTVCAVYMSQPRARVCMCTFCTSQKPPSLKR